MQQHDVTLTYFHAPDCAGCEVFGPMVTAAAQRHCLALVAVNVRDEPDRAAIAGVRTVPALVAKVDGIPVGCLGPADELTVEAFLETLDLVEM